MSALSEEIVVIVHPRLLAASPGAPLFGRREPPGCGVERWWAVGSEPAEGLERLGSIVAPGAGASDEASEELLLTLGEPPQATLAGARRRVHIADLARYRDRVRALPDAEALQGRTVAVVGLGSVGSDLGARLARLGAAVLGFDPDVIEVENAVRWGLLVEPLACLGLPKAAVFEATLRRAVPGAQVEAWRMDVARERHAFARLLQQRAPDLVITATDTWDSRLATNALARLLGLPHLIVGLSDQAASLRLEVVEADPEAPCHLCAMLAEEGLAATQAQLRRSAMPYAMEGPAPTPSAGVPALPVDVGIAAALATRLALLLATGQPWRPWMQHGAQRGNVLFMSLRPDFWVFDEPWSRLVYAPERHPACGVCNAAEAAPLEEVP